jgi:hypothetical protein
VRIDVVEVASASDPRATNVRYVVRNQSDKSVWVVDDGWVTWRQDGDQIELSYARVPMQPGVQPFGYFDPAVVEVAPGDELERTVTLTWPQPLSRLWNAEAEADPPPGEYDLTVRIGYGVTPKPAPPQTLGEGVEAPVLAWQREAVSEPARLTVPA